MKKILLSLIVLCVCLSAGAQQQAKITVFQKEAPARGNRQVVLNTVSDGKAHKDENAVVTENTDGSVVFELTVTEPVMCYLGGMPIYVSGGDDITVALTGDGYEIVEGGISPENRALMDWMKIARIFTDGYSKGGTYSEFFARLEEMARQADEFGENLATGNPEFDAKLRHAMRYEIDYNAIQYKMMLQSPPAREVFPGYYDTILIPGRFDDDLVLNLPFGDRYLSLLQTYFKMERGGSDRKAFMELIGSPVLRNRLIYGELRTISSAYEMRREIENCAADLDDAGVAALNKKLDEIVASNDREAVDFTFPDVDGNQISLSDFRGKVVLIDVWATWCTPCMYQLPYLLKLEEKLHGESDIVFMGISMDKQKDYDKWAALVRNGDVKGIQLFTNNDDVFANDYAIKGIPRFIIVGRDGRIVEFDAPRPSNPILEQLLDELLGASL